MGFYTTIYIYPENSPTWQPDATFVQKLAAHAGIESVYILSGQSSPDTWESTVIETDEDGFGYIEDTTIFQETRIPIEKAIAKWIEEDAVFTNFICSTSPWSKKLTDSLWPSVPPEIRGECHPWDTGFKIGPWSTCEYGGDTTVASASFALTLSSDRPPLDNTKYLSYIVSHSEVTQMLDWLSSHSGIQWTCVLTVS